MRRSTLDKFRENLRLQEVYNVMRLYDLDCRLNIASRRVTLLRGSIKGPSWQSGSGKPNDC